MLIEFQVALNGQAITRAVRTEVMDHPSMTTQIHLPHQNSAYMEYRVVLMGPGDGLNVLSDWRMWKGQLIDPVGTHIGERPVMMYAGALPTDIPSVTQFLAFDPEGNPLVYSLLLRDARTTIRTAEDAG